MKIISLANLLLALHTFCGCTTTATINAAKGFPDSHDDAKGQPAFYLLVPITIPFDIVGTPFYYLLWAAHTEDHSCGKFFGQFFETSGR